ncbi:MAG: SUMF1/EgtB/PvdO family nonheme iron enzyme [Candidatus Manganitrophus sp.]|nr:MAG: SUMF1/EgtB/PvdO family nonheme iron enzyme [Candidatus Manganitrophus sp.]
MAWIPAGEFMIGSDEVDETKEAIQLGFPRPWFEDEHPLRKRSLPGFYIDRHETTQEAYFKFVTATNYPAPAHWPDGQVEKGKERHPVTNVDWYEANDYCRWAGKRLPTEEEWEKAARGPKGRRYPWGDTFEIDRAHLSSGSGLNETTRPVGSFPAGKSPYGVDDMIGNVWEWTDSWYLPYPGSALRHPDFGMKHRVVRGLSYMSLGHYPEGAYRRVLEVYARASTRSYDPPAERLDDVGFRCAKSK